MPKVTFVSHLDKFLKEFEEKAKDGIDDVVNQYHRDMTKVLDEPPLRSGKRYLNVFPSKPVHIASAPGEPPAPISGYLRDSLFKTEAILRSNRALGFLSTPAKYAITLEFGGYVTSVWQGETINFYLQARPAWQTTIVKNRADYGALFFRRFLRS